jgi:hypothetical protein
MPESITGSNRQEPQRMESTMNAKKLLVGAEALASAALLGSGAYVRQESVGRYLAQEPSAQQGTLEAEQGRDCSHEQQDQTEV